MIDYIDKEIAAKGLRMAHDYDGEAYINAIPSADVVEVRHGRWLSKDPAPGWSWYATCSACGERQTIERRYTHYCPNCGAEMRDGDGE